MTTLSYKIIRSDRKTMSVTITAKAEVEVRAPQRLPEKKIAEFIKSKEAWILAHLKTVSERLDQLEQQKSAPVDRLPYLGKELAVTYVPDGRTLSFDSKEFIFPALPFVELKDSVIDLYKKLLRPVILPRVGYFANRMKVSPANVKINGAMKRWGSCSGKNALNFSWMLAAAAPELIDYVVVHELAHITEHNHSKKFWAIVEKTLPDYQAAEKKLKEVHQRLTLLF